MSAYNSDDTYNVISEHFIEAMQADSKLGTSGALEIQKWEEMHREGPEVFADFELPAITVEINHSGADDNAFSRWFKANYTASIFLTTAGVNLPTVKKETAEHAARIERVIRQQSYPTKQIASVYAALDQAQDEGVKIGTVQTIMDAAQFDNGLRGAAMIVVEFSIEYLITID